MNPIVSKISKEQVKKDRTAFAVGDTVKVHTKVVEGEKERVQIFSGVVIARKGNGIQEAFTVRRISYGEGVERVFPLHSPRIDKVEIEHHGRVRRAKLYYLRDRIGKGAVKVKEQRVAVGKVAAKAKEPVAAKAKTKAKEAPAAK